MILLHYDALHNVIICQIIYFSKAKVFTLVRKTTIAKEF